MGPRNQYQDLKGEPCCQSNLVFINWFETILCSSRYTNLDCLTSGPPRRLQNSNGMELKYVGSFCFVVDFLPQHVDVVLDKFLIEDNAKLDIHGFKEADNIMTSMATFALRSVVLL